VSVIVAIWNVCFLLKFGYGAYNTTFFDQDVENASTKTTFVIAGAAITTEFIPYLAVIDTKFINIFSLRFLNKDVQGFTESRELLEESQEIS